MHSDIVLCVVILSVITQIIVMLSAIKLSVVMLCIAMQGMIILSVITIIRGCVSLC